MDCNDYKDRIISYIENELDELDRKEFENELQTNSKLKEEYLEVKALLSSLSELPKLSAPSDFIVSLNNKIEAYELKEDKGWNLFINKIFKSNYFPRVSVAVMSLIFVFSLVYFWDSSSYNSSSVTLSNSSSTNNNSISNEIADLDSLEENSNIDK